VTRLPCSFPRALPRFKFFSRLPFLSFFILPAPPLGIRTSAVRGGGFSVSGILRFFFMLASQGLYLAFLPLPRPYPSSPASVRLAVLFRRRRFPLARGAQTFRRCLHGPFLDLELSVTSCHHLVDPFIAAIGFLLSPFFFSGSCYRRSPVSLPCPSLLFQ